MRITYLHYLYGQDTALNHVRQFAAAARQLGHQIDVHAMNLAEESGPGTLNRGVASRIREIAKGHFKRYLHEPKELLWNIPYYRKEVALVRASKPDVLLVRDHALTASCIAVARRVDVPLVLEVNAPAMESILYGDEYAHVPGAASVLEGWKVGRADAVAVVSTALKKHLIARHGVPAHKLTVVPNGADVDAFRPDVLAESSLFDDRGGTVTVGFVGSFKKWHGTRLLGDMITAVGAARPEARFLLVGDGPERGGVQAAVEALGDRVRFLGAVPHARVPSLVASLDVAVMPESNFYGSPLKVVEWMAAGRAVVAPGYGPVLELIDDGVEGLVFEPGNGDALVRAVLRLIDQPALRHALGTAASVRVRSSLSWTANARRVMSVCERAMQQRCDAASGPVSVVAGA